VQKRGERERRMEDDRMEGGGEVAHLVATSIGAGVLQRFVQCSGDISSE
jgi:hypothetical protein